MALFPIGPEANRQPDIKPKGYIYRQGTQPISFAGLGASAAEIMALRAHIDEAKDDPDYAVVISYKYTWIV